MMRNKTVDALKGYAIILVVIGHAIENIVYGQNNKVDEFVNSFHMPLFMFLSGYVIFGRVTKPWSRWIWIRAERLLIPYIVWLFISNDFFSLNGLWFLMVLFILYCILLIIRYLKKYLGYFAYIWIFLFLLILPVYGLWWCDYYLRWHYIFFFAGYLIAEHRAKLPIIGFKSKLLFCGLFIACFFLLPYQSYSKDILITSPLKWTFNLTIACLGIAASYSLISWFADKWIFRLLSFLGLYTLEIYVMHPILLRVGVLPDLDFGFYPALIFNTLFTLCSSVVIAWVIRRSTTLKLIFFGLREKHV
jgi:fucose 4-O-acetylase-like acetyltransferase